MCPTLKFLLTIIQDLAVLHTRLVAVAKRLKLTEPQFPSLCKGDGNRIYA